MVFRLFVEKRRGADSDSLRVLGHIKEYASLEPETKLRLFDRYDFDGLSKEEFDVIVKNIICDDNNEVSFIDYLPLMSEWKHFAVSPINGKYNRRVDFVRKTAKVYGINKSYKISTAKVIALSNIISEAKLNEIAELLIDPRFYEKSDNNKPLSLEEHEIDYGAKAVPDDFTEFNDIQIYQYLNTTILSMPKETLCKVRDYFKLQKRNPTLVELFALDSYFSALCQPKYSRFNEISVEENGIDTPLKITLDEFINARKPIQGDRVRSISPEEIAFAGYDFMKANGQIQDIHVEQKHKLIQMPVDVNGVVEQYFIGFHAAKIPAKKQYERFPSSIDGLNTASLMSYQAADLDLRPLTDKKERFKKTYTFENASSPDETLRGIAMQNKALSIPTTLDGVVYSKSVAAPISFCATACAGTAQSFSGKINKGDSIIMLGSKIKTDDIGSEKFIQKSNPDTKIKIEQFFREISFLSLIKRAVNFDNGMISGLCEIEKSVTLDINRIVGKKYLNYAFLALSAPNERVAIIVSGDNIEKIKAACYKVGLSSHIIGEITDEGYLIIKNGKKQVANIGYDFIDSLKPQELFSVSINDNSHRRVELEADSALLEKFTLKEAFLNNLKSVVNCSKMGMAQYFDSTQGAGTILSPFGGKNEITPCEAFVCKIPTDNGNTNTVTAVSHGCNPKITALSPYHGAAFSIMECISRIVAVGANSINAKLAICQSVSDPKNYASRWSKTFSGLFGAFAAETGMNIPAVSYDLSKLQNDNDDYNFTCFAVAGSKATEIISSEFKSAGSTIILVPMPTVARTGLPDFDRAKVMYRQLHYLSQNGKVLSAGVVNEGGIASLVAKMSLGNEIGVDFEPLSAKFLFSPQTASIVVETQNPGAFSGMDTVIIGKTTEESYFNFENETVTMTEAMNAFTSGLQAVYPTKSTKKIAMTKIESYHESSRAPSTVKIAKPKVVIPVFSSFSGANDCQRAFENHGAICESVFINHKYITDSVKELSEKIKEANIICLPSGSADSSSAFGYSVMKTLPVADSIMYMLQNDGLILGIEQGFDILLKCGLLTDGRYKEYESGAYLSQNTTGIPVSGFASTKIISNKSPWLSLCETDDIHTVALSHEKGRFVVDETTMLSLMKNNQIATQYIDKNHRAASKLPFNPDGSVCAIEGITSPDGRIFGKMGQTQRRTRSCFSNIHGNKDQRIFEAGVKYFM